LVFYVTFDEKGSIVGRLTVLFFIFRLGFVLVEVKFGLLCYFLWKMLF